MFKYASIDIETTGLNPEYCQIIQFGAVLDDLESPIGELPRIEFLVLNRNKRYRGDSYALQMNKDILAKIASFEKTIASGRVPDEFYCFPDNLAQSFRAFLIKNGWAGDGLLCAGKNYATFDARFLGVIPDWETRIKPRNRVLDPGSMYYELGDGSRPPGMEKCKERAGIEGEVAHTAVADAIDVIKLIRYKMEVPF